MAAKLPSSLAAGLSPSTSQCGTPARRGPAGLCHRLRGWCLFPRHLKAAAPLPPHPTLPAPLDGPQGAAELGAPGPPMLEPLSRGVFLSCPVTQRPCLDLSVVEGWAGQVWGTVCRYFSFNYGLLDQVFCNYFLKNVPVLKEDNSFFRIFLFVPSSQICQF